VIVIGRDPTHNCPPVVSGQLAQTVKQRIGNRGAACLSVDKKVVKETSNASRERTGEGAIVRETLSNSRRVNGQ
jgi:hypothetical protein